jgi:EamA domain-containing membrane protein RarD
MITRAVWVAVMGGIIVVLLQIWGAALPVLITTICTLFASYQVRKTEMAAAAAAGVVDG